MGWVLLPAFVCLFFCFCWPCASVLTSHLWVLLPAFVYFPSIFCSHLFTRQSRDQLLKVFIPGLLAFSSLSLWSSVSVIQHAGISLLVSARFWTFLIFFLVCFAVSCLSHVFLACLMSRIPGVICPVFCPRDAFCFFTLDLLSFRYILTFCFCLHLRSFGLY